jgi:hypothetical protein
MSANYCGAIAHVFVVRIYIDHRQNNILLFLIGENYFFLEKRRHIWRHILWKNI